MVQVSFRTYNYSTRRTNGRVWITLKEGDQFQIDGFKYEILSSDGLEVKFRVTNSDGISHIRKMTPLEAGRLYYNAVLKSRWTNPPTINDKF
jgi:hypothetical protein